MGIEPYAWPNKVMIPYPKGVQLKGFGRLYKMEQKATGWGHVHQRAYNIKVAHAIRAKKAESLPMVLHNDPELAVFLREQFPQAYLVSHFYNHNTCSEKFRLKFGGSAAPTLSTAVSDFTARWVEGYYGLAAGSVKTLYNGVDCDRFAPAQAVTPEPPVVNFVGRTSVDKGPDLLLKAALRLARQTKEFKLQLLGSTFWGGGAPDPFTQELERLAEELMAGGIEVRMPGFIDRWALPDELRKAHIHVVPSRWEEPFALSTLEGMATGLATIASSTGGTPEAVRDAGLLFEKDDLDNLTEYLNRFVTHAVERERYGALARDRAQEFTWLKIWRRLRELVGV
jgi:glycosyltransferase involved in cell wall biosynthesis